ncbi:hypothetical protein QBC43DRAFT_56578 [Cladorrhinum sp. PSN259]|nr:hypothetical protein QBC43DRAFT_56578 [Cladorrhinum sp. PSN259]
MLMKHALPSWQISRNSKQQTENNKTVSRVGVHEVTLDPKIHFQEPASLGFAPPPTTKKVPVWSRRPVLTFDIRRTFCAASRTNPMGDNSDRENNRKQDGDFGCNGKQVVSTCNLVVSRPQGVCYCLAIDNQKTGVAWGGVCVCTPSFSSVWGITRLPPCPVSASCGERPAQFPPDLSQEPPKPCSTKRDSGFPCRLPIPPLTALSPAVNKTRHCPIPPPFFISLGHPIPSSA